MSIVRLVDVSCQYGALHLFGPVSATIEMGDRIGLIGPNGSGKSSLLRLIAGVENPAGGRIYTAQRHKIGYLAQETENVSTATAYEIAMEAVAHITALAEELRVLERERSEESDPEHLGALMDRYSRASEQFERAGGYQAEAAVKATLFGLGLDEDTINRPLHTLSGGERARAWLARLLVSKPDLMILDEPTNHLDVDAIEWLEGALQNYAGAFIVVSHDRYFLDAVTNRIWELDGLGGFATYRGNYSAAAVQREERRARQQAEYEAQQEEIERLEAYVRRYRAGNRATMAKSRERRLARMERIERPAGEGPRIRVDFGRALRGSRIVAQLEDVGHAYGDQPVLQAINLVIERGDRVGIIGPNGSGKSTLLSIIAGRLTPTSGRAYLGRDLQIGYYRQEIESFTPGNTVIDELLSARHMPTPDARSYLARFLFRGDDVFKPVETLSGGEKRRLMLAKLLVLPTNVLCLDEPTNHLDISTRETLEEALLAYTGTLLFVSHDRYFLSRLASRIVAVRADGRVEIFGGGYEDYRQVMAEQVQAQQGVRKKETAPKGRDKESRSVRNSIRELEKAMAALEHRIEALEQEKAELEEELSQPDLYTDDERAKAVTTRYRKLQTELQAAYAEWEDVAMELSRGQ